MRNIGLFFGSFNPIHVGHLIIGSAMLAHSNLDEVWYVVSPQNPLKERQTLLADQQRLEMVRRAVHDDYHMRACDVEFHLPIPSYTISPTIRSPIGRHPYGVKTGSSFGWALPVPGEHWSMTLRSHSSEFIARL